MEIFSEPSVREFAVRLCLTLVSEVTTIRSHQRDCLTMSLTRATIDSRWGKPTGPSPTKNHRQPRNVESRKIVSPREDHHNLLSST